MNFTELIRISRPRFWLYLFGPLLIALAASGITEQYFFGEDIKGLNGLLSVWVGVYLLYFLFPANLLIYGVNDLSDEDTDQWNEKKGVYENKLTEGGKHTLTKNILARNIPFIIIFCLPIWIIVNGGSLERRESATIGFICLFMFYFTGIFYSALPVRAKAKPFLDGYFNVLYVLPGFALYHIVEGDWNFHWIRFIGAWSRCIAMHTFSAIPDIDADKKAGLTTTAVLLGKNKTLLYCLILWIIAAIMGFMYNAYFGLFAGLVYVIMIYLSFKGSVFGIYKWFPRVNSIVGFVLFRVIILL